MAGKRGLCLCLIVILLTLGAFGCGSTEQELSKVRIAHFPNVTHGQALVARYNETFEKYIGPDLEIEYFIFNAGPSEIEAFFAGELDLGYIGPVPAINGNIKSRGDLVILAGATNAGAMLMVAEDSNIESLSDLDGRKIAVPQIGNTQHLSLLNLLSQNGLKDTSKGGSVEVVPAANPDIKVLLENGDVDAAYVPEPWASRLIYEIGAEILLDEREVFMDGNYSTALVIGRKDFVDTHPDVVEKFLRAHLETTDFMNSNADGTKKIMNEQIESFTGKKLDESVMDSVFTRLTFTYDPVSESVMLFMDISKEEEFIDQVTEKENLFYFDVLNKILTEENLTPVE